MSTSTKLGLAFIPGPTESLKLCTPNLMPFHIDYTGPAPVTAFMRVEKLAGTVQSGSEAVKSTGNEASSNEKCGGDVSMDVDLEKTAVQADQVSEITEAISTGDNSTNDTLVSTTPPILTRTTTETTLVAETPQTTLDQSISLASSSSQSQFGVPPIDDLDRRFVSAFRGRSIHGLTLDLPEGYTGVVLKVGKDLVNEGANVLKEGGSRENIGDEIEIDMEMERRRPRRKGRLTSSAAPRKATSIIIPDDDEPTQKANSTDIIDLSKLSDTPKDDPMDVVGSMASSGDPCRVLIPSARFDSFTLWQTDRMVDKTSDEYWRTLNEWIGLAHEVVICLLPLSSPLQTDQAIYRSIEQTNSLGNLLPFFLGRHYSACRI